MWTVPWFFSPSILMVAVAAHTLRIMFPLVMLTLGVCLFAALRPTYIFFLKERISSLRGGTYSTFVGF